MRLREVLHGRLLKGLVGVGLAKVGGLALAFATVVTLSRVLGPAQYGAYAFVFALVSFVSIPVQLGLPMLVIRETARAQQDDDLAQLKGLWRWSSGVAGGLTVLVVLLSIIGLSVFAGHIPGRYVPVFLWGLAVIPFEAWGNLCGAALTGLRKPVLGQLPDNILRPGFLLVLLSVGVLWVPAFRPTAQVAMALAALAALLTLLIIKSVLRLNRPTALSNVHARYRQGAWLTALWPLSLVIGMQVINRHTDVLMLGFFVPVDDVGVYRVTTQVATLVSFPLQIVNMAVAPHFARLHAAGQGESLQQLVTASARLVFFVALPIALMLIAFGHTLLSLVFGAEYASGATPLVILTVGQLVNAGAGSVALLLNMAGHEKESARGVLTAALVNVPLNLVLIPYFGMNGAAFATALSLVTWNVILWRAVRRRLGVDSTAFRLTNAARAL